MSFLYTDKELLEKLVKAGLDAQNKEIIKKADKAEIIGLAKKMVQDLKQKYDPHNVVSSSDNVDITPADLNSLDSLVAALQEKDIEYNGTKIVTKPDTAEAPKGYLDYMKGNDYFAVNKDAIVGFLKFLKDKADKENIAILKAKLTKVLNELNLFLTSSGHPKADLSDKKVTEQTQTSEQPKTQESTLESAKTPEERNEAIYRKFKDQNLPLILDKMDFRKITNFLNLARKLSDVNQSNYDKCTQFIADAKKYIGGSEVQDLRENVPAIQQNLVRNGNKELDIYPYYNSLNYILASVKDILQNLESIHGLMRDFPKQEFNQQMIILDNNKDHLDNLRYQINNLAKK